MSSADALASPHDPALPPPPPPPQMTTALPHPPQGGGSADTALSPSLRAALAAALAAVPGAELVTLSNLYGLPVLRMSAAAAASSAQHPQPPDGRF
jgi:hypothetical protein